ncbi:MAG: efflux RND transporter permease subunit, partial [Pseudomonadales bacterium]|nr:efflux RND transporter permease subunit [Pseudomonadales bacterium]
MRDLIVDGTLSRLRTSMILMIGIMLFGLVARVLIPVEANPSVVMPLFSVQMAHQGISPEDASKLLAEPLEVELKSVEGINEVRSYCKQGMATVQVEFNETTQMDVTL